MLQKKTEVTLKPQDIDDLVSELYFEEIVNFSFSADGITAFIMTIAGPIHPFTDIAWGGEIKGKFLVAVRCKGSNYFSLKKENPLSKDYVNEKLCLDSLSDSVAIADLLNAVSEQMPEYTKETYYSAIFGSDKFDSKKFKIRIDDFKSRSAFDQISEESRAMLRPENFPELSPSEQGEIDKILGILDWGFADHGNV